MKASDVQPMPVVNSSIDIQSLVVSDINTRRAAGTPLQPYNGRDALLDAYQEARPWDGMQELALWEHTETHSTTYSSRGF